MLCSTTVNSLPFQEEDVVLQKQQLEERFEGKKRFFEEVKAEREEKTVIFKEALEKHGDDICQVRCKQTAPWNWGSADLNKELDRLTRHQGYDQTACQDAEESLAKIEIARRLNSLFLEHLAEDKNIYSLEVSKKQYAKLLKKIEFVIEANQIKGKEPTEELEFVRQLLTSGFDNGKVYFTPDLKDCLVRNLTS